MGCCCSCPQYDCNELDPTPIEPIAAKHVVKANKAYEAPPIPTTIAINRLQMHAKIDTLVRRKVRFQYIPDGR